MNDDKHVRLSSLTSEEYKKKFLHVVNAADEIADMGGSPRAQLDAARKETSTKLTYKPHIGAKQKARQLERMKKDE